MLEIINGIDSVILGWNHAQCDEGISHYRIYINDAIGRNIVGNINSIIYDGLEQQVEYSFYIVAVTNKNRISEKSNTIRIMLDLTSPQVNFKLNFNLNFNL